MVNLVKILLRKSSSFLYLLRFEKEQLADWLRGVDFTSPVSRRDAGTLDIADALHYSSTAFIPQLSTALKYLAINGSDAILDYGSGKGAVLVKFREYPFGVVSGIELSSKLMAICRKNLKKLQIEKINLIEGDATAFLEIDRFNYFYFANPFTGHIFSTVIDNIINSVAKFPRTVRIIYYNPKCHDMIMNTGKFFC